MKEDLNLQSPLPFLNTLTIWTNYNLCYCLAKYINIMYKYTTLNVIFLKSLHYRIYFSGVSRDTPRSIIDPPMITLEYMTHWTLLRSSATSSARKPKSIKYKRYKHMLIFNECILVLCHFAWDDCQSGMPRCETPVPQTDEREDSIKIHTSMFPSYPSKGQNVNGRECGSLIQWVYQKIHRRSTKQADSFW